MTRMLTAPTQDHHETPEVPARDGPVFADRGLAPPPAKPGTVPAAGSQAALYLYGITIAGATPPVGGVAGAAVEAIAEGVLAAIVSRLGGARLRPQRAHLAAHHRVLRDLARTGPVLPVVFGTLVPREEELRSVLRRNHAALADRLARLDDKVEMGLKVYWDVSNVFEYFVATHQELEAMRDRLFRLGRTPPLEEKVALGEMFAGLLQQARQRHARRVQEALAPCSVELRSLDAGDERMILKCACLVESGRQAEWEEGVRRAAGLFDDHYRFEYNGPWPPYNFAEVDL